MFIQLTAGAIATLEDSDNFKAFKVVSQVPAAESAAALGEAGQIEGEHVWIAESWLTQNGPDDAAWREGFAKMLGYAAKSGWINEAGAVRAHIEWA